MNAKILLIAIVLFTSNYTEAKKIKGREAIEVVYHYPLVKVFGHTLYTSLEPIYFEPTKIKLSDFIIQVGLNYLRNLKRNKPIRCEFITKDGEVHKFNNDDIIDLNNYSKINYYED